MNSFRGKIKKDPVGDGDPVLSGRMVVFYFLNQRFNACLVQWSFSLNIFPIVSVHLKISKRLW